MNLRAFRSRPLRAVVAAGNRIPALGGLGMPAPSRRLGVAARCPGACLLAALSLCASMGPACAADSLLANGSFETVDAAGQPVGWQRFGKECERVVLTDGVVARTGKRSARLLPILANNVEAPGWMQEVPCTPGQVLRLTGYIRCRDCVSATVGLRLFWRDAQGAWVWQNSLSTPALKGTVGWAVQRVQGAAPPGAVKAVVLVFGDAGAHAARGITWCDDVSLETLVPPTDWAEFRGDPAAEAMLPAFCWPYDRAVVAYAFLEDAVRGLRRASYYRTGGAAARAPAHLAAVLTESSRALLALRDRYRAVYPLVQGKPANGWPLSYAACRAAYHGDADLGKELRAMTAEAERLLARELRALGACAGAHGAKRLAAWAVPDLRGADPPRKRRLVAPDGRVERILFGGSGGLPESRRKHNRLMQYDYEMQTYEMLDWPERERPLWHDEKNMGPFVAQNLGADLIVHYSNHGWMYCPQWLWPQISADADAFVTERALPAPGAAWTRFPFLNLAHPRVRAAQDAYLEAVGRHFRGSLDVCYYRGPWEAYDAGPEWSLEGGHDRYSLEGFRSGLARRYGSIARLNAAWGTRYPDFDSVPAAPSMAEQPQQPPSALGYAFQAYRKERFMGWWKHCYEVLKRADPSHAVATDPCARGYNADVASAVDYSRLPETGDIVSVHWADTAPWLFSYLASLGRLALKTLGVLEYCWNAPECWSAPPEPVAAAAGQRNLWNGTALGVRLYNFYGQNDTYVPFPTTATRSPTTT